MVQSPNTELHKDQQNSVYQDLDVVHNSLLFVYSRFMTNDY
jgi:hypothetical protein